VRLRFERLAREHDRAGFSCGHPSIDEFLQKTASQRQERRIGATQVAVDADGDPNRIVGFYTLLPHEFRGEELPDPLRKGSRVGRLSAVPGALLARLGVALPFQSQGIGKKLVSHALERVLVLAENFGCVAMVTDPIDTLARTFYEREFDFQLLGAGSSRLILSVRTISMAFAKRERPVPPP
jgi:GNAT superfamily N-acetyltransferase